MRTYNYECDSLPDHILRARNLRKEVATMREEMRSDEPVPYWYVDRFRARQAELATVLQFRGVRLAVEGRS